MKTDVSEVKSQNPEKEIEVGFDMEKDLGGKVYTAND